MTRFVRLSLVLVLVLGLAAPAAAQGPGVFVRPDCTTLTAPVTGQTWCFDATARAVKVWNGTAYDSAPVPPTSSALGGYTIRNLVGQNDATTPNTKFGYSADLVQLRNPTDGAIVVRVNTGTLTNDTGLAGSSADGRDQAAAFSASIYIHFYFIWNGTTLATLSSTVAPPTGPTLPTGYTHWAYAAPIRYNATPLLVKSRMRGVQVVYEAFQSGVSAGTSTTEVSVDVSAVVPANALAFFLNTENSLTTDATAGRTLDTRLTIRYITGVDFHRNRAGVANTGIAGVFQAASGTTVLVPNIGQAFIYLYVDVAGAVTGITRAAAIDVLGYVVPNGGE